MSQRICRHGDKVANMEAAEKKREYRRHKRLLVYWDNHWIGNKRFFKNIKLSEKFMNPDNAITKFTQFVDVKTPLDSMGRKGDVLKGEWGCYDGIRIIGDDGKELHGVLSPTVLSQQFVKQVFHGGGGGI